MDASKTVTITKKYERKLTRDYQSFGFLTELSTTIEISSKDELEAASSQLFLRAKSLTEADIATVFKPEGE